MSGVCIALALGTFQAIVPAERFTLAWDHTVEKVRWEEDYQAVPGGLRLTAARIRGQGAGMEVPPGAIRVSGAWQYRPELPVLARISLARAAHYELCWAGTCRALGKLLPEGAGESGVEIRPCDAGHPPDN